MTAFENLRDRLTTVTGRSPRQAGPNLAFPCPAHDDPRPSLSIRDGGGRALLICRAGCDTRDVLARLDMAERDLYDEPCGNDLARYQYVDMLGNATRTVHRRADKDFTQSGERSLVQLYRLPQIADAARAGTTIYLVEGEADVHALETVGVVATTAPQGSSAISKVDLSPLRGATVIAVRDNDAAGEKWSREVKRRLAGYAATLTIMQAREGKDASDHLLYGHTIESFVEVPDSADDKQEMHQGQLRLAERFIKQHNDILRYVHGINWYVWDGKRWAKDAGAACAYQALSDTLKNALRELAEITDPKIRKQLEKDVRQCERASAMDGILKYAARMQPITTLPEQLDGDPWLFNVDNGTLDLRTSELRPHDRNDLITKIAGCGYQPEVAGPLFRTFIAEILPDEDVRGYVQRLLGSALYGGIRDHVLPIFTGQGSNGKSTLVELVRSVFGGYAIAAEPELLVETGSSHPTGQADLLGVRLATTMETDEGRRLAPATVKRLTGGDRIRARHMRQDFFEFPPTHTIIMVTNRLPSIRGDDPAIWRRIQVVPFDVTIEDVDLLLPNKLDLERGHVLAWIFDGYCVWSEGGLMPPDAVKVRTREYRADSDAIARFLDLRTRKAGSAFGIKASVLWQAYKSWCESANERAGQEKDFAKGMRTHGYESRRDKHGMIYDGLLMYEVDTEPSEPEEEDRDEREWYP